MHRRRVGIAAIVLIGGLLVGTGSAPADTNEGPPNDPGFGTLSAGLSSCAIVGSGLKCWGDNNVGQLGQGDTAVRGDGPGEMGDALAPIALGTGRTAVSVSMGDNHACAVLDNGTLKCWGHNNRGQLGQGDATNRGLGPNDMGDNLPVVDLGGTSVIAVSVGSDQTCALLGTGAVKCWGGNGSGQLGLGDTSHRGDDPNEMGNNLPAVDLGTGRTATAIAAGTSFTCALLDNGTVKCWGDSTGGQLGQGDITKRGDAANEMGDALPAVDLGTGRTATQISASAGHVCALLDDSSLKCWGANLSGQLGLGDSGNRGDAANEMGDALPTVDLGTGRTAVAVAGGGIHTCAILDDGSVKCWGDNNFGALGLGDLSNRGDFTNEMGDALPTVDLGTGRTATAIAAGLFHTCARLDDGSIKCWGHNAQSELGLGDTSNRGDAANEMGDALPAVDLGAPVVTITTPPDGAVYPRGAVVTVDFGCSDVTSVSQCAGSTADGQPLPTNIVGPGVLSVTAIDSAGNITDAAHEYQVVDVTCFGQPATVYVGLGETPTAGDDVIVGTPNAEVIRGLGGDDLICGFGGDDELRGGSGLDRIRAGNDDDELFAGPGGGLLAGNAGTDVLHGGSGKDTVRGGPGDDDLRGGRGNDLLDGGANSDTCSAFPGRDTFANCEAIAMP